MKYTHYKLADLSTYEDCMEAIDCIENHPDNVRGGVKAFNSGLQTQLLKAAQDKVDRIQAKADLLIPDDETEEIEEEAVHEVMIRTYLRASTDEQDAKRSQTELKAFAAKHGKRIAAHYIENESGATLERPQLRKLLDESESGDIILIEHIDRFSRLNQKDWTLLKAEVKTKGLRLCIVLTPQTHTVMQDSDEANWMRDIINDLVIELGACMARSDYELRRKRQAEGIAKAKAEDAALVAKGEKPKNYKGGTGRKADQGMHNRIAALIADGWTNTAIAKELSCSTKTVQRHRKGK